MRLGLASFLAGLPLGQWVRALFCALGAALLVASLAAAVAPQLRALRLSSEQLRRDYQALQAKMRGIGRARGKLDEELSGAALENLKMRLKMQLWRARESGNAAQAAAIQAELTLRGAQSSTEREAVLEESRRLLDVRLKPLEDINSGLSRLALVILGAAGLCLLGGLSLPFLGKTTVPAPNPEFAGWKRAADRTARVLVASAWAWIPLAAGAYLAWAQSGSRGEEGAAAAVWIAGMGIATALGGLFVPQAASCAFSGRDWAGSRFLVFTRMVYPRASPLDWVNRACFLILAAAAVLIATGLGWVDPVPCSLAIAALSIGLLARTVTSSAMERTALTQEPWLRLARWAFAFLAFAGLSHAGSLYLPSRLFGRIPVAFFVLACAASRRCFSTGRECRDPNLSPGMFPVAMKNLLASILLAVLGGWWSMLAAIPWLLAARAMWAPEWALGRLLGWLSGKKPAAAVEPSPPYVSLRQSFQAACFMAWLATALLITARLDWVTAEAAAVGVSLCSMSLLAIAWRSLRGERETWPFSARRAFACLALAGLCYAGLIGLRQYGTLPLDEKLEAIESRLVKTKAIAARLPKLEAELAGLNKSFEAGLAAADAQTRTEIEGLLRKRDAKLSAKLGSDPKAKDILRLYHKLWYAKQELEKVSEEISYMPALARQGETISQELGRLRWWARLGTGLCASLFALACLAAIRGSGAYRSGRGLALDGIKVGAALSSLLGSALLAVLAPGPWSLIALLPWLLACKAMWGIELPWLRLLPVFGDAGASPVSLRLLAALACLATWGACAWQIVSGFGGEPGWGGVALALFSWVALAWALQSVGNQADALRKEPWFKRAWWANTCLLSCAVLPWFKEESLAAVATVLWYLAATAMWDVPFLGLLGGFFWRRAQKLGTKLNRRHPLIGELALLTRYLCAAASRGLPLAGAVHAYAQTVTGQPRRDALARIEAELEAGSALAQAVESLQAGKGAATLPHCYLAMLKAGEAAGDLPAALRMALEALREEEELSYRLRTVMTYFAAVAGILGTVFFFLLAFVVPLFKSIFDSFGLYITGMGWPTRLVFWLAGHPEAQYPVFLVMAQFFLLIKIYEKGEFRRLLPGMRGVLEKIAETQACHSLAWLLAAGCPADQALELAGANVSDAAAGPVLRKAAQRVRRGESVSAALGGPGGLSREFQWACALGEHRGDLPDTLRWLGGYLRLSARYRIDLMIPLVERSATVAIGLLVGLILVAVFTPMFWLGSLPGGSP